MNELEVLGKTKIHHPNIVQLREVIEDKDDAKMYLVMQYLKGKSIQTLLDQASERIEAKVYWKWARALISALFKCHEDARVCHNDIKPDNLVVLDKSNRLVLVDFGVSFSFDGENDVLKGNAQGTMRFFAPEIVAPSQGKTKVIKGR